MARELGVAGVAAEPRQRELAGTDRAFAGGDTALLGHSWFTVIEPIWDSMSRLAVPAP